MAPFADTELYHRGAATMLACWGENARGSAGAALLRLGGVAAAVFPSEPERAVYNNALIERDLGGEERAGAIDAMERAYAAAGIDRFAAWVHESDEGMRRELDGRGYRVVESTLAMGMALDGAPEPEPAATGAGAGARSPGETNVALDAPDWAEYLRLLGVPEDFLAGADPAAFQLLAARLEGENVATGMAFDHDGDCGVFNVGTLEPARRRGLGTALTARLLADARARGCLTASVQSTPIAEGVYARLGFRDLGRFLEFAP